MLYTSGTTGLPKGVMYANGELRSALWDWCDVGTPVAQSVSDLAIVLLRPKILACFRAD